MRIILILGLVTILFGCQNRKEDKIDLYFDMEDQVTTIIDQLKTIEHKLYKSAIMDNQVDSGMVTLDSTGWIRELQLFSSANINLAQNQGNYEVSEREDSNSNLKIRKYEHKDPDHSAIPLLEVYYLNSLDNCKEIKLNYRENNTGFSLERELSMSFEEIRGQNLLHEYRVNGYQKILGRDTVRFSVRGLLSY